MTGVSNALSDDRSQTYSQFLCTFYQQGHIFSIFELGFPLHSTVHKPQNQKSSKIMGRGREKAKTKPLHEIPPHATEGSDGLLYLDPGKVRWGFEEHFLY